MCVSVGVKCEQMLELKLHYRRIRSVLIFKDVARVFCDGEKNFPSFVIPDNFYSRNYCYHLFILFITSSDRNIFFSTTARNWHFRTVALNESWLSLSPGVQIN